MKEVIPVRWLKTDSQTLNLLLILTTRFLLLPDTSVLHLHLSPCRHSLDSETPVHSLHTPDASQPSTLRPVHPLLPHHLLQGVVHGSPRILAAGLPFPGHAAPDPLYPSPTLNLVRVILRLGRNWHQRRWPWTLTILRNSSRPSGSPPSRPALSCISTCLRVGTLWIRKLQSTLCTLQTPVSPRPSGPFTHSCHTTCSSPPPADPQTLQPSPRPSGSFTTSKTFSPYLFP
ncbi:hypothetical protein PAMA_003511 [Pampus argenteus]